MIRVHENHAGLVLFLGPRTRRYILQDMTEKTWCFRGYSPQKLQAMLACEVAGLRRDRRQFWCALACAALTLLALRCGIAYYHGNVEFISGLLCVFAWFGLTAWLTYSTEQRITRQLVMKLVRLLQRHDVPESAGALIDAMETGDGATPALVALLPRLRRQDAFLLNGRRRAILYREMRGYNSKLILAILQAFEQVGDDRAIPHVKRLTACPVWLADSERIEADADRCLRILCATAGEWKSRRLLLRTASAPAQIATGLVCPAQAPANVPSGQLLRAVDESFRETRGDFTAIERQVVL